MTEDIVASLTTHNEFLSFGLDLNLTISVSETPGYILVQQLTKLDYFYDKAV